MEGTLLLTFFPQLFITIFFAAVQHRLGQGIKLPFEEAVNGIYAAFLVAELAAGYVGAKKMIRVQAAGVVAGMASEDDGAGGGSGDGEVPVGVVRDFHGVQEIRVRGKRNG
ncbi:hypothetical protein HK097_000561 [Rhizophlyctis rosea]|uniref:Uncharacterized protein n=1 Tax=Rhizophlyctis rosea TaxID=64517 RepID=A0AAD5SKL6_9FUNG|nr:hypothetical protein HK097_000561 [Rhizophlyctis rosea]